MKRIVLSIALIGLVMAAAAQRVASPNGNLTIETKGSGMVVCYDQQQVLDIPTLGLEGSQATLKLKPAGTVKDDYQMLAGKRLHCTNEANVYQAALGKNVRLVVRLYNDGLVFRYELSGLKNASLPKEQTAYRIPEGTKRWMQQWSDGYEGFFPMSTTAEVKTLGGFGGSAVQKDVNTHWGYPLLMEPVDGVFALITEANIERRQSASSLFNKGEVFSVVQDQNDLLLSGGWHTPWRVVIIGTLADIVQSTLVTDVSEPSKLDDTSWIKPGVVSWIYWAYNHGSNDYNIIRKYVDMAVTLKLPYVLIDAEWDEMDKVASNEGKTIEDAVKYALSKGVKPLIWYNSSIGWVNGAPGPKFRLNKPEDREKEFAWCEKIGVAGVKIDFFSGDNQTNMDYCQDLLESAARHHLLVNFHGAPIPRGWQRTYPNLLSTEGVYGAEWYNNVPHFTKKAAAHNATLPFTRNVIGPMDYTPCAFSDSQHPHITSNAHELALTVLFESGLQHLADRPESFLAQPQEVQQFLSTLPNVWDETRLLDGYPAERVVMARRSGNTWYVAGINGLDEVQTLKFDLSFLGSQDWRVATFADPVGGGWDLSTSNRLPSQMICQPRGGFILKISPAQPTPLLRTHVETGELEGIADGPLAVYKAIPYAAPPVGDLRWRAPQPAKPWEGVLKAENFGPWPPQPTRQGRTADMMSEDCLYLGIATPATSTADRLPVMVWIHGGGFQTEHYGGDLWKYLAMRGVVIVSVEYRTGALGFMAHPELSKESPDGHSGNYGLLDQIYALQWVQRNITNFGGDPTKVTIFGESAGAISCSLLCGSPLAKGLFRAAISQSGGSFAPWSDQPRSLGLDASQKGAEQQGLAFQKHLKKKSLKELRKMDAMSLCDGNVGFAGFWPCVDGYVITDDQYRLYERGEYNDVPVIVMTNSDEGALFSPGNIKAENYQKQVRNIFGSFADEALKVYPGNTDDEAWHGNGDAFRDVGFAWPSYAWVSLQTKTGKSPAYAAFLAQPSTRSFSQDKRRKGVAHADDILYLNGEFLTQPDKYPNESAVAEIIQEYWVNFAKTCNPNGEGLPYWPSFDDSKPTTMQFSNGASLIMRPNREQVDFVDRFYKAKREETEKQRNK